MKKESAAPEGFVGRWFHSLGSSKHPEIKDPVVVWQGRVVALVEPGFYLVECMSWADGQPSQQKIVRLEEMLDWLFYEDAEWMRFSYEHGAASAHRSDRLLELAKQSREPVA